MMDDSFDDIASTDLRDLAKSLGWHQISAAVEHDLFVLESGRDERRQIVFPVNSEAPDYIDAMRLTLRKLSEIENIPVTKLLALVGELHDDVIDFRIVSARNEEQFIPLEYAVNAINGVKETLLAAASTVLRPQIHHPRLSRAEAVDLVGKSRFRQTEIGSFVMKVSTPVRSMDMPGRLYGELPFVRQTTLAIGESVSKLITAIRSDTVNELVEEQKRSATPVLSSNLCKALTSFQDTHNDVDLYLSFKWAASLGTPTNNVHAIKIQKEYFSRIAFVSSELKQFDETVVEEIFFATVEDLLGDVGSDGRRAGIVILNLYKDSEQIRARAILDADNYQKAHVSHITPNSLIRVKGHLGIGNQPRNLLDISVFDLILP